MRPAPSVWFILAAALGLLLAPYLAMIGVWRQLEAMGWEKSGAQAMGFLWAAITFCVVLWQLIDTRNGA